MISPGDLAIMIMAISLVVLFFLTARHFIRHAQQGIDREDVPAAEAPRETGSR